MRYLQSVFACTFATLAAVGCDNPDPDIYTATKFNEKAVARAEWNQLESGKQSAVILENARRFDGQLMKITDKQPFYDSNVGADGWQFVVENKLGRTAVWGYRDDPTYSQASVGDMVTVEFGGAIFPPYLPGEALSFTRNK